MKYYDKFSKKIFSDKEGYESATPEIVADYRASRLKCRTALDCCCGIGGDTIALAKHCEKVVSVDKSAERIAMARRNAALYGLKNVRFINSDIFKCDLKAIGADIAFADPQRRRDGERVNSPQDTEPSITKLIPVLSKHFDGFCIEAPSTAEMRYDCEREYVSWDSRKGKRECILSLYFGSLNKCGISSVVLPSMERIEVSEPCTEEMGAEAPMSYLYEPKVCIERAGIRKDLAKKMGCTLYGPFLASDSAIDSSFFENSFKFLTICDKNRLTEELNGFDVGKIVLRAKLQPDEHERMKKGIEEKLSGTKKLHVFSHGENFLVCESLSIKQNERTQNPS